MILLLHANFYSFATPNVELAQTDPFGALGRLAAEHLCIVSVNVYVLVSGWFGIHPRSAGLLRLLISVITYALLGAIVGYFMDTGASSGGLITRIAKLGENYWFVVSYLLLYILAPVLNSFAEHASRHQFRCTLVGFYLFEIIGGWMFGIEHFDEGYSTLSFVGLYLLARYMRLYDIGLRKLSFMQNISGYLLVCLCATICVFAQLCVCGRIVLVGGYLNTYISPTVIISSLFLFFAFEQLNVVSPLINRWSTSALAVYLIHNNPHILPYYRQAVVHIYEMTGGYAGAIGILVFAIVVMVVCLVIDKCRAALTPLSAMDSAIRRVMDQYCKSN